MLRLAHVCRGAFMPLHQKLAAISANVASEDAWAKFDDAVALAVDVKETDTVLALAQKLLTANQTQPSPSSWIGIFQALRFVEIESGSVTVYQQVDRTAAKRFNYEQFILKMAGGVVPMTLRRPASRGWPILEFAKRAAAASALGGEVTDAVMAALREHAGSVCLEVMQQVSGIILENDIEAHVKLAQLLALPAMNTATPDGQQLRGLQAGINLGLAMEDKLPPSWTALVMQGVNDLYTKPCGASLLGTARQLVMSCESQILSRKWNLEEGVDYEYRLEMLVALLRCSRLESPTSDFLESFDQICTSFDFSCTSLRPLVEKLAAMCEQLFDNVDDKELVNNIVLLLRRIVDLRPRDGNIDCSTAAAFQEAHRVVISTFAAAGDGDDGLLSEAYWIVVAHKFHGLAVTSDLILPLAEAMSNKGDGRIFNLADACVVYCGNKLEPAFVTALFRTCSVAGDHHRARTMLQLLKDVVPGYLAKAPADVVELLEGLKVLPPRPGHLFDGSGVDPPALPPLPQREGEAASS